MFCLFNSSQTFYFVSVLCDQNTIFGDTQIYPNCLIKNDFTLFFIYSVTKRLVLQRYNYWFSIFIFITVNNINLKAIQDCEVRIIRYMRF